MVAAYEAGSPTNRLPARKRRSARRRRSAHEPCSLLPGPKLQAGRASRMARSCCPVGQRGDTEPSARHGRSSRALGCVRAPSTPASTSPVGRELQPARTDGLVRVHSAPSNATKVVLADGHRLEVVRVDAARRATGVVDNESRGDRAIQGSERDTMRPLLSETSVVVLEGTEPQPATGVRLRGATQPEGMRQARIQEVHRHRRASRSIASAILGLTSLPSESQHQLEPVRTAKRSTVRAPNRTRRTIGGVIVTVARSARCSSTSITWPSPSGSAHRHAAASRHEPRLRDREAAPRRS